MLARFVNSLPTTLSNQITKLYFQALAWNRRESHSEAVIQTYKEMDVKILPALEDNYMYLIVDKSTNTAAVVDPVNPTAVLKAVEEQKLNLSSILTTHHHWDHAGGNIDLANAVPGIAVYGGDQRIGALTNLVAHNTTFNIGNLLVQCLFTPCHTTGHVCYFVSSPNEGYCPLVFTGDTLFVGGCGRFFEGTPGQMYRALISILSNLPDETKVFCGHEYTLQNLKYANYVEPNNENVLNKITWSQNRRKMREPTVPSTIKEEKLYNPFMRVHQLSILEYTGQKNPIEAMKVLRMEKDNFK